MENERLIGLDDVLDPVKEHDDHEELQRRPMPARVQTIGKTDRLVAFGPEADSNYVGQRRCSVHGGRPICHADRWMSRHDSASGRPLAFYPRSPIPSFPLGHRQPARAIEDPRNRRARITRTTPDAARPEDRGRNVDER